MLDFGHFHQFLSFLLGLRRQCTPMALQTDLLAFYCVYPCIENMIYKLSSSVIAHWQGLTVAKMGFCHFLGFFLSFEGTFSTPTFPAVHSIT